MKSESPVHSHHAKGSALVITLVALVLVTIIAVGYISSVMFETKAARAALNEQKAYAMAELAMHSAVGQLRDALGSGTTSWDNPFANFMGSGTTVVPIQPAFFWSVSPGLLTRWEYSSAKFTGMSGTAGPTYAGLPAVDKYPLFSGTSLSPSAMNSVSGTLAPTVNLNRQKSDGTYPIISGSMVSGTMSAPPVSVQWVNVVQNPGQPAGSNNRVIGRFAYWVDDENAKININTADGTNKTSTYPAQNPALSLGAGSPTEVSLQMLVGTSGTMTATTGSNIVQIARTVGFHSPREILRAAGTTPDLYTGNVFNITCCSRSPELNIFGQPRIPMLTALELYQSSPLDLVQNAITMQPVREIYPTASQLPALKFAGLNIAGVPGDNMAWPTAFNQLQSDASDNTAVQNVNSNHSATAGMLLAYLMAGKNPAGTANFFTWPSFPGTASTTTNFLNKYTPRQIDSIAWQITDLGGNTISSDVQLNPDTNTGGMEQAHSAPTVYPGWLSAQYVSGMGRSPKVTKFMLELITKSAVVTGTAAVKYAPPDSPPEVQILTSMEWWLPAGYQGTGLWSHVNTVLNARKVYAAGGDVGEYDREFLGCLNVADQAIPFGTGLNGDEKFFSGTSTGWATRVWSPNGPFAYPGYIEKVVSGTTLSNTSYWGNNLLTNNQGIDFTGNPGEYPDPDQTDAATYHPYLSSGSGALPCGANTVSWPAPSPAYMASGSSGTNTANPNVSPILYMNALTTTISGTRVTGSGTNVLVWVPGEIRVPGAGRNGVYNMMNAVAGSGTLTIAGGLASISYFQGRDNTEMDVVPMEASRANTGQSFDKLGASLLPAETAGQNSGMKIVRDRLVATVVTMNGSVSVPADSGTGSIPQTSTLYIYASVAADPLVNKFPGDWITTTSPSAPATATNMQMTGSAAAILAMQTTSVTPCNPDPLTGWYDPDSYWVPTMDGAIFQGDLPAMPRSARFPSIGYLNYVRTGIIPDDETVTYSSTNANITAATYGAIQHGTPYRLLDFAPSYDPANSSMSTPNPTQKTANAASSAYPDWAMLDLMYVPSMLLCYGSPYASYAGATYTPVAPTPAGIGSDTFYQWPLSVSYSNTAVMNNMFSYGTYGGATSGRINPNGAVIYTSDVNNPATYVTASGTTLITRTIPLQAMLQGIPVNQNLVATSSVSPSGTNNYIWSGGASLNATNATVTNSGSIAGAIATYLQTNGPLRLPAEICNIPAIAAMAPSAADGTANGNNGPYAKAINNPTRNDLVRQIVGNLTTQSNTFSVWVAGQSVQKIPGNTNYGQFETGDNVLGDVRYHFIVERYLDPGADGVYGNIAASGTDGVVGTLDDPVDPVHHPFEPRYLYRVISAEQIR